MISKVKTMNMRHFDSKLRRRLWGESVERLSFMTGEVWLGRRIVLVAIVGSENVRGYNEHSIEDDM
jgi:hypothetical protein